ncbi:hypothetical protein Gohar_026753 [Gossypium harknessii]|uniref:Uncharacterized protein n=1 Tax=Gossypium harknessii TaxID=34285 RepID=A0A7J9HSI7_9ROSI|nr:hypothetical protein [Gossypium harknessii]
MNKNITLPHGTYFSYVLRQLGISTHGDTLVSSNQSISYGALHHAKYHFDVATNTWMKHDQPGDNEDDDIDTTFDDILVPEPIAPPLSLSHTAPPPPRLIVISSMLSIP